MNNPVHTKKSVYIQVIAVLLLSLMLYVSCADNSAPVNAPHEGGTLAMIAPDPLNEDDYILIHGFLDTADSMGIPARLYTFDGEALPAGCADKAIDDGCAGAVLVGCDEDVIKKLQDAQISVITLLSDFDDTPSVLIDDSEYYSDAAEFILEKLNTGSVESGTVLIYGAEDDTAATEFEAVFPDGFTVKAYSDGMSMTGVCAIYAVSDTAGALSAVADAKDVIVMGSNIEEGTEEQFENGLYALCVRPLYEAAAQSVISLDKLTRGDEVQGETLRRAILTAESSGLDRCIFERYRALLLFDVITPTPAPTVVIPTDEAEEPAETTETATPTEEP